MINVIFWNGLRLIALGLIILFYGVIALIVYINSKRKK